MATLQVRIIGPHKHAGRDVPIGEVIELPEQLARLTCSVFKTGEPVDWPERPKKASKKRAAKDS